MRYTDLSIEEATELLYLEQCNLQSGFESLLSLPSLPISPKPWQEETALRVLRDMHGNAILADEVGLGKTIEAGLILSELLHRGLAETILILVPAPLVDQWKREMEEKFGLVFADYRDPASASSPLLISSLPYASRSHVRREELADRPFDVVVVDEAHALKNQRTQAYKLVYRLQRRFTLLMSATPIQNDLKELFNLVNLLKPGYFKNRQHFLQSYVEDRFTPKNVESLRPLLKEVMVRHRRSDTLVELPKRVTEDLSYELGEAERSFHDGVIAFCQRLYREHGRKEVLRLVGLLKQNSSSPESTVRSLESTFRPSMGPGPLRETVDTLIKEGRNLPIPHKTRRLLHHLSTHHEKALVFTEFRGTLAHLEMSLESRGIPFLSFHGGLTSKQKTAVLEAFQHGEARVLLATESGSQGLNLQFARMLYNYDLPWNPMRIEQRIGRIHRFGQKEIVKLYTLTARGTFDEYLLHLLSRKIHLFEMVIGELDSIMSFMAEEEGSLDVRLGRMILEAQSPRDIEEAFHRIGESFTEAKNLYLEQTNDNRSILDEMGVMEP